MTKNPSEGAGPSRPPHPLNTAELGTRFVIRRVLANSSDPADDGVGQPELGDVLGLLVSRDASSVGIEDRRGVVHRIPKASIAAAKPVPPAPERRRPRADT